MAKVPALSTQLKNAETKIVELEKKLSDMTKSKDNCYENNRQLEAQIEQLQCVFDALPDCIPRKAEGEYVDRKPIVRLAAWLGASKKERIGN